MAQGTSRPCNNGQGARGGGGCSSRPCDNDWRSHPDLVIMATGPHPDLVIIGGPGPSSRFFSVSEDFTLGVCLIGNNSYCLKMNPVCTLYFFL